MSKTPRILIACEFSGVVRDAFIKRGFDAVSCDLLPTASPGPHIQGDVRDILNQGWSVMIAHPPCTYLSSSGMHWTTRGLRDPKLTEDSLDFVRTLLDAPIERIALENPVGAISTRIRKPDQIIQPWWFGDDASKKTCLWLKNLPLLVETNRLPGDNKTRRANQTPSGQNKLGPSDDRWAERSKTYQGIADAIADQWGACLLGFKRVSFAADCGGGDEDELGDVCSICGQDYTECECPGPTMDEMEYREFGGVLYARPQPSMALSHDEKSGLGGPDGGGGA